LLKENKIDYHRGNSFKFEYLTEFEALYSIKDDSMLEIRALGFFDEKPT
jgi:hypothetical protein